MKKIPLPPIQSQLPKRLVRMVHKVGKVSGTLLYETFSAWYNDDAPALAAALAFFTLFSLAPTLLVAIAISGLVFGPDLARLDVVEQVRGMVGDAGARVILAGLQNAADSPSSITASVAAMLLGATAAFVHLQNSLNTIWGVMPKPGRPIKNLLKARFLSFLMVLGAGFFLLLLLTTSLALSVLSRMLRESAGFPGSLIRLFNYLVSPVLLTLLFALIYKIIPDAKIRWWDVWVGAAVTSFFLTVSNALLGFYLGTSGWSSFYGAASSLVISLLWVYISAQIFFFGAEFTHVYARKCGTPIVPSENAVRFTREIHLESRAHRIRSPDQKQ